MVAKVTLVDYSYKIGLLFKSANEGALSAFKTGSHFNLFGGVLFSRFHYPNFALH